MSKPISLFRHPLSGHAHRVELMLSLLNLPTELVFVDLAKGAHKQPEFLAKNPLGQVPVLDDNGTLLNDSNAILVYLATAYGEGRWLPTDAVGAAQVQEPCARAATGASVAANANVNANVNVNAIGPPKPVAPRRRK